MSPKAKAVPTSGLELERHGKQIRKPPLADTVYPYCRRRVHELHHHLTAGAAGHPGVVVFVAMGVISCADRQGCDPCAGMLDDGGKNSRSFCADGESIAGVLD